MNEEEIIIHNEDDLQKILDGFADNPESINSFDLNRLVFRTEPICVRIEGPGYDSTISTSMMKLVVNLQERIYSFVKIAKYPDPKAKLAPEDIAGLELFVRVERGSSQNILDLSNVLQELCSKMNGWQSLAAVAIIAASIGIVSVLRTRSNNNTKIALRKLEVEKERIGTEKHAMTLQMIGQEFDALTKVSCNAMELFSRIDNARISIDGIHVTKSDLHEAIREKNATIGSLQEKEEDNVSFREVEGTYRVTNIRNDGVEGPKRFISLININDPDEKYNQILLTDKGLTSRQRQLLIDAIDGLPVRLKMRVTENGNKTPSILIIEFNGERMEETGDLGLE